jgi:hypothetical protein
MTEQMTLTVKEEALGALRRARTALSDDIYTTEELYATASSISNLAPHFIRWAAEDQLREDKQ